MTTDRLRFRTWTRDDLDLAYTLWSDPQVSSLFGGPFSRDYVAARLEREIDTEKSLKVQYWPIFLIDSGEHVGCCGIKPEGDVLELGFHLRPAFWGRGLATEAASATAEWGFVRLGLDAIYAGHHPENLASRRVLEKLGFRYLRDQFYPPSGACHPFYVLEPAGFRSASVVSK